MAWATTSIGRAGPRMAGDSDEDAFRRLVEPLGRELLAHCYRMLGSLHDAEDAVQETLLRAWRGLPRFEGRASPRAWLHRIATNVALDMAARRPPRGLPPDPGPPAGAWLEPFPDDLLGDDTGRASPEAAYEQREAIELAFVAALQHLPPRQRAALILRDVLGFSAREAGDVLATSTASVESALQRARAAADDRLPERSQQATMRELGDAGVRDVVQRFVTAFEGGDVPAIVGLLTEDAWFAMPPHPEHARGRDAVAESWLMPERAPTGLRYAETRAALAKEFIALPPSEIERLLDSPIHEVRVGALSIMDKQGRRNTTPAPTAGTTCTSLYLRRHDRIDNLASGRSRRAVRGRPLPDRQAARLLHAWRGRRTSVERRTAIVATAYFIRQGYLDDTFRIAEIPADRRPRPLIARAAGGWLREAAHARPAQAARPLPGLPRRHHAAHRAPPRRRAARRGRARALHGPREAGLTRRSQAHGGGHQRASVSAARPLACRSPAASAASSRARVGQQRLVAVAHRRQRRRAAASASRALTSP